MNLREKHKIKTKTLKIKEITPSNRKKITIDNYRNIYVLYNKSLWHIVLLKYSRTDDNIWVWACINNNENPHIETVFRETSHTSFDMFKDINKELHRDYLFQRCHVFYSEESFKTTYNYLDKRFELV